MNFKSILLTNQTDDYMISYQIEVVGELAGTKKRSPKEYTELKCTYAYAVYIFCKAINNIVISIFLPSA